MKAGVDEETPRRRANRLRRTPSEYGYEPGYYAVFFRDPDGLKLELVHVPDRPDAA